MVSRRRYEFGVTVQMWGATPPCGNPPGCKDKQGKPACCTADCQVLGVGAPEWSLIDPSNPETGGVRAHFTGIPASACDYGCVDARVAVLVCAAVAVCMRAVVVLRVGQCAYLCHL